MKRLHSTALVLLFTALLAAPLGGKAAAAANPIAPTNAPAASVTVSTGLPPASYLQTIKTLQENKYGENEIKSFVYQVFSLFDRHAEISQLLLLFAEDINMVVPEGKITSHQEFEKWYRDIGLRYQSNAHQIERIVTTDGKVLSSAHIDAVVTALATEIETVGATQLGSTVGTTPLSTVTSAWSADATVSGLIVAMAAMAPPAASTTLTPADYQNRIGAIYAANVMN